MDRLIKWNADRSQYLLESISLSANIHYRPNKMITPGNIDLCLSTVGVSEIKECSSPDNILVVEHDDGINAYARLLTKLKPAEYFVAFEKYLPPDHGG
jgi:hypothetical protein